VKIVIPGGSGLIGGILTPHLRTQGHEVTILTRQPILTQEFPPGLKRVRYDPYVSGAWQDIVAESDVIINLAGLSIFRYWTPLAKHNIIRSRVLTTHKLVEALAFRSNQGKVLLNISGAGIYGPHGDEALTDSVEALTEEDKALTSRVKEGKDFLAKVAEQWEEMALNARQFGLRVVLCRIGNVLSCRGGMLPKLIWLAKYHLGCRWGSGLQWNSWVHEEDLARSFTFLIENPDINGPVNVTAPQPTRNSEMMRLISQQCRKKPLLPYLPAPVLRLAAGEFSSVFLTGQKVIPRKLLDRGFRALYPDLQKALEQLITREPSGSHF
jgi:uncharacterized protein